MCAALATSYYDHFTWNDRRLLMLMGWHFPASYFLLKKKFTQPDMCCNWSASFLPSSSRHAVWRRGDTSVDENRSSSPLQISPLSYLVAATVFQIHLYSSSALFLPSHPTFFTNYSCLLSRSQVTLHCNEAWNGSCFRWKSFWKQPWAVL